MPSNLSATIERAFQSANLRSTAQRYAVMEFLAKAPVHATADEIWEAVNQHDPRVSRATVYNNLHSLAKAGMVHAVQAEGKAVRFDANLHRHHHFICEDCGTVEDIAWFDLPPAAAKAAAGKRQIRNYEIVFRGACVRCKGAKQ